MSEVKSSPRERLRRLLFLVPFISRHPGLSVDEVARAAAITRAELLEELEWLTLVGRPPFQPDDFIDIYVDDDKVFVELDQRLSAPPRLSAAEGVALAAAAELMRPLASETLDQAKAKLERVLPKNAQERFAQMARQLDLQTPRPQPLALLNRAAAERVEVEFDYFTLGRGQTERRRVQPYELFSHRGEWYLSGFCLWRKDERLFRVDRMAEVALTEQKFVVPEQATPKRVRSAWGADPSTGSGQAPEGTGFGLSAKVRFSARAAPYARELFGADVSAGPEGCVEVRFSADSEGWLTGWVISFGGEATVLEPESARQAVARWVKASLES